MRRVSVATFEGLGEGLDEGADFVSDAAVVGEGFVFGSGGFGEAGWVVEAYVDDLAAAEEGGASFVGAGADGDDVVEGDGAEIGGVLGAVVADVYAGFFHDFDGEGVEAVGVYAGGPGVEEVGLEVFGPAFGHLASATVAGAEEEDFGFGHGGSWYGTGLNV
jgi:hypothetical protein